MKRVKIGDHFAEVYDAIEELPVVRFHKFNKLLLVDAGIGSDLTDIDKHIERVQRFILSGDTENAAKELQNMRQCLYFIASEVSPEYMAFAALIHSLDGQLCEDLSDEGLAMTVQRLSDASHTEVTDAAAPVKKKITEELELYFPGVFEDAATKEYYDLLRRHTLAVLDSIAADKFDEQTRRNIDDMTTRLITYIAPQVFAGPDSIEIKQERDFDNMCTILSRHFHTDARRYTVREFYNALELLKKENKQNRIQK